MMLNITDSLELDPMFEQVPNYVDLDEKVSLIVHDIVDVICYKLNYIIHAKGRRL